MNEVLKESIKEEEKLGYIEAKLVIAPELTSKLTQETRKSLNKAKRQFAKTPAPPME